MNTPLVGVFILISRIADLKNKQLVCMSDGAVLGYLGDVEFDVINGKITSFIIYGRLRLFGLLGRDEDIRIPFEEISVIGNETILVSCSFKLQERGLSLFGRKF